eukprot:NODE_254_length_11700_cov_0.671580.p6 type:complete len:274 gc:universal NODE_254_length_11700_cov_0.671580:1053-232(-)
MDTPYLPLNKNIDEKFDSHESKQKSCPKNKDIYWLVFSLIVNLASYELMKIPIWLRIIYTLTHFYYFLKSRESLEYILFKLKNCIHTLLGKIDATFSKIPNTKLTLYLLENVPTTSGRSHHLDSLRGIACVIVVFYHIINSNIVSEDYWTTIKQEKSFIFDMSRFGHCMVEVFVVLSGFILAKVYWNSTRSSNLWNLMASRISRFYPLHWFTALIYAAISFYYINVFDPVNTRLLHSDVLYRCLSLTHMWRYYDNPVRNGWFNYRFVCNAPSI